MPDIEIVCEECKLAFPLTVEKQTYYNENGYTFPTRCEECENKRKAAKAAEKAARKPKHRPRR